MRASGKMWIRRLGSRVFEHVARPCSMTACSSGNFSLRSTSTVHVGSAPQVDDLLTASVEVHATAGPTEPHRRQVDAVARSDRCDAHVPQARSSSRRSVSHRARIRAATPCSSAPQVGDHRFALITIDEFERRRSAVDERAIAALHFRHDRVRFADHREFASRMSSVMSPPISFQRPCFDIVLSSVCRSPTPIDSSTPRYAGVEP